VKHAEEVAQILRQNVVQGKKLEGEEDGDRYSRLVSFPFVVFANVWLAELRIHEHTERGDNDTIKMPNGKTVVIDGKKCSDP
jgi:complex III assembly factor LYRM7